MSEKFRVDNTDKWKMHAAKNYHAEISYHGKDFFVLFLAFIPVSYYFYVRLILEKTCKSVFYLRYVFFFFPSRGPGLSNPSNHLLITRSRYEALEWLEIFQIPCTCGRYLFTHAQPRET